MTMLHHHMKMSLRNLMKQKGYALINIAGLAVGIAVCLLILLYVQHELSYDDCHEKADRVYRFGNEVRNASGTRQWGWTYVLMADFLEDEFPEVERATRILTEMGETQITYHQKGFVEDRVMYSDPQFFDHFTVPLISGDPVTALKDPHTVIISQSAARRYFGDDDPMGKVVQIRNWWSENEDHVITGVAQDMPYNAHFHFDFLISYNSSRVSESENWGYTQVFNYVLLKEGTDPHAFEAKLPDFIKRHAMAGMDADQLATYNEYLAQGYGPRLFLQPLRDIHLRSHLEQEIELNGNIMYVRLFSVIALFVLLIACINFMNLSTARSTNRVKEVGIRKTLGSERRQLVAQFLVESIFLCFVSMGLALILLSITLPAFRTFAGIGDHIALWNQTWFLPGILLFTVGVGILSGSYPSLFLSSFDPIRVMKNLKPSGSQGRRVRNGLVIFQFMASIALIASTWIIKDQIHYMTNTDLGYDKEQVIVLSNGRALQNHYDAFRNELLLNPSVVNVAVSGQYPAQASHVANFRMKDETPRAWVSIFNASIGEHFVETLGMEIIRGRNLSYSIAGDSTAVLLNETAVRALGIDEPIGAILDSFRPLQVVGVIQDFHFRSMHYPAGPLVLFRSRNNRFGFISIRIQSTDMHQTLSRIASLWSQLTDGQPFHYSFLDDYIGKLYMAEQKTSDITSIFSGLAILIACLGLFGLAAYTTEQKTKEIGIRKALGATSPRILLLLSSNFMKLIAGAFILSVPISYFLMNHWLQNFAFRIAVPILSFLYAGLLTLIIALLTVSYQVLKASRKNPVDALRYE
jgi:putative ABC transport system permease protein